MVADATQAKREQFARALRAFRTANGLTQQDVVERLNALAWQHTHTELGVDRQMVSKWERGAKLPQPHYRDLFILLFASTEATPPPGHQAQPRRDRCGNSRIFARVLGTRHGHSRPAVMPDTRLKVVA
jgi:transcriptional regulator with XRE-family HTH domain